MSLIPRFDWVHAQSIGDVDDFFSIDLEGICYVETRRCCGNDDGRFDQLDRRFQPNVWPGCFAFGL
jgi:hypothetical protein